MVRTDLWNSTESTLSLGTNVIPQIDSQGIITITINLTGNLDGTMALAV